jgi:hypothetical protein
VARAKAEELCEVVRCSGADTHKDGVGRGRGRRRGSDGNQTAGAVTGRVVGEREEGGRGERRGLALALPRAWRGCRSERRAVWCQAG